MNTYKEHCELVAASVIEPRTYSWRRCMLGEGVIVSTLSDIVTACVYATKDLEQDIFLPTLRFISCEQIPKLLEANLIVEASVNHKRAKRSVYVPTAIYPQWPHPNVYYNQNVTLCKKTGKRLYDIPMTIEGYPHVGLVCGIELEVATKDIDEVKQALTDAGIVWQTKRDSSIHTTSEYHTEAEIVLQALPLSFYQSNTFKTLITQISECSIAYNQNCGLHVHINRTATAPGFGTWCAGFMQDNCNFFKAFSKRKQSQIDAFCKLNGQYTTRDRYCAIRPTQATSEIRLWRGTTDYARIRASIEMTFALVQYHKHTVKHKQSGNLDCMIQWLEVKDDYAYLYNYLIQQGYINAVNVIQHASLITAANR